MKRRVRNRTTSAAGRHTQALAALPFHPSFLPLLLLAPPSPVLPTPLPPTTAILTRRGRAAGPSPPGAAHSAMLHMPCVRRMALPAPLSTAPRPAAAAGSAFPGPRRLLPGPAPAPRRRRPLTGNRRPLQSRPPSPRHAPRREGGSEGATSGNFAARPGWHEMAAPKPPFVFLPVRACKARCPTPLVIPQELPQPPTPALGRGCESSAQQELMAPAGEAAER